MWSLQRLTRSNMRAINSDRKSKKDRAGFGQNEIYHVKRAKAHPTADLPKKGQEVVTKISFQSY